MVTRSLNIRGGIRVLPGAAVGYRREMTRNPATFSLAMTYAPATKRPALEALFALDDTLAGILRTTREPLVGQMRLTWCAMHAGTRA